MKYIRFSKKKCGDKYYYVFDEKGIYIFKNNEFVYHPEIQKQNKLRKEYNKLVKDKPFLKKRLKHIKNFEKRIYYAKVWIITEQNDLTKLKNYHKRGFHNYHLHHIYPISQGYKNKIPPKIIGNIKNLKMIPAKENLKLRDTITEEAKKIIKSLLK